MIKQSVSLLAPLVPVIQSDIPMVLPQPHTVLSPAELEGVAVTLMLRAPKWFHRRYTVMLHNVLSNIPSKWAVQVFVNTQWLEKDVLPLHPGLSRLYQRPTTTTDDEAPWTVGRITWTPLPKAMTHFKPKDIMKSEWLWKSVLAENVLLFGGNGALCANTQTALDYFVGFDFVGAPWTQHQGRGGDGSTHSFRHKSAMLQVLEKYPPNKDDSPDYAYFVNHMVNDNMFQVANRKDTMAFAGVWELDQAPFLLSGTQAGLNYTLRDNVLSTCPELKVIFPSLHEPACFGAHPNGPKCKESICALQDKIPGSGC